MQTCNGQNAVVEKSQKKKKENKEGEKMQVKKL
jgi:hypothetical protein